MGYSCENIQPTSNRSVPYTTVARSEKEQISGTDLSDVTSMKKPVKRVKGTILEPAVLLVYTATNLTTAVLQNQELYQACVTVYNYDEKVCEPLLGVIAKDDAAQVIETEIQPYVARIIMASSLISSILPAFLSLFIGPWSDRHGRRPILLATFAAAFLGHLITTILAGISMATPVNPWIYVISNIPLALTGGTCALATIVYCLISDVSDDSNRAKRLFLVEGAVGIAMLVGSLTASYLLALTGTIGVFGIAAGLDFIAFVYLIMMVDESLELDHERKGSKIKEFIKFDLIRDLIKTCVRRRSHYERGIIWCLMFAMVAISFVTQGEVNVFYLFTRNKLNLTLQDYTTFNAVTITIKMVGCGIILIFLRVLFKVPLTVVTMLGLVSCLLEDAIKSAAQELWHLYLSSTMGVMSGFIIAMFQYILASLVDATEIGKVYAIISSLQTLSPLASSPVYTGIYNATLETYPGAFYLLSCLIYLLCLVLILIMFIMQQLGARSARAQAQSTVEAAES